jgi:hypothetical protein
MPAPLKLAAEALVEFWRGHAAGVTVQSVQLLKTEGRFVKLLPLMRLALADLTPRETDLVANRVATLLGAESLKVVSLPDVDSAEMLRAVEVNRQVQAALAADGLEVLRE